MKKVIRNTIMIAVCFALCFSAVAKADEKNITIKSSGRLLYNDEESGQMVLFDADDFTNVCNKINSMDTLLKECFISVSDGKKLVASAITDAGIDTAEDATFQTMSDNINQLNKTIIDAVNSRGGTLDDTASNVDIANAIKGLQLSVLGTVTYTYHHHDNSCYGVCGSKNYNTHHQVNDEDNDGTIDSEYNVYYCSACHSLLGGSREDPNFAQNFKSCSNRVLKCGRNEGEIVSATITY